MYREQIAERRHFYYPPFYRLIYVFFKHRDERTVAEAASYATRLRIQTFEGGVLGPDKPFVGKVHMLLIRQTALKISPALPIAEVRAKLHAVAEQTTTMPLFRSVAIYFDVDPL